MMNYLAYIFEYNGTWRVNCALLNYGSFGRNLVEEGVLPCMLTIDINLTSNSPSQLGQKFAQSVYGGIGSE